MGGPSDQTFYKQTLDGFLEAPNLDHPAEHVDQPLHVPDVDALSYGAAIVSFS
jgi:hypothetical protein